MKKMFNSKKGNKMLGLLAGLIIIVSVILFSLNMGSKTSEETSQFTSKSLCLAKEGIVAMNPLDYINNCYCDDQTTDSKYALLSINSLEVSARNKKIFTEVLSKEEKPRISEAILNKISDYFLDLDKYADKKLTEEPQLCLYEQELVGKIKNYADVDKCIKPQKADFCLSKSNEDCTYMDFENDFLARYSSTSKHKGVMYECKTSLEECRAIYDAKCTS